MQMRHDQFGKRLLIRAYQGCGDFVPEQEVSPDAQRFDGYFIPHPDLPARGDDLLYRLGAEPTAFELMSAPPSVEDLTELIRKLLNARHVFALAAPPRPLPRLWVLSAGHPRTALEAVEARPAPEISPGVHLLAPAFTAGLVVLSQLPEVRSTLLLRLMAAGETRRRAVAELAELPADAWERRIAENTLVESRYEIVADPNRTPDDEEFMMQTENVAEMIFEKWRTQGVEEGRREGDRRAVIRLYAMRFGEVPSEIAAAVHAETDDATLLAWFELVGTKSAEEIAAALASPRRT